MGNLNVCQRATANAETNPDQKDRKLRAKKKGKTSGILL